MKQIYFSGCWKDSVELMDLLTTAGFLVAVLPHNREKTPPGCDLIIVRAERQEQFAGLRNVSCPWLAWCTAGEELQLAAYEHGALAVFPASASPGVLMQFVQRHFQNRSDMLRDSSISASPRRKKYHKGDIILLDEDAVLEVEQGIIAQSMVHTDGAQVLLGLMGAGCLVIPHPTDTCYIQLLAHSEAAVLVRSWEQARQADNFDDKLRCRLQHIEAWAAMQARPHLDQRVIGILSLLADQFGVQDSCGRIVDVRITHTQLASAVGATRTTITRTLGDLRRQGVLSQVQTADGERFCLLEWEDVHHGV